MNAYNLTCQRYKISVQGSVLVLTPSPGAINTIGHLCILPERVGKHGQRSVYFLAAFPSSSACPSCILEIV